jgi:hypothetical protein
MSTTTITVRPQKVSDNFNYKRIIEAWRDGGDYSLCLLQKLSQTTLTEP